MIETQASAIAYPVIGKANEGVIARESGQAIKSNPTVQGALLLIPEKAQFTKDSPKKIEERLNATRIQERWALKDIHQMGRLERKQKGAKFDTWQKQVSDYLKYYRNIKNDAGKEYYKRWQMVCCKALGGITPKAFDENIAKGDRAFMKKLSSALYDKDGWGEEAFMIVFRDNLPQANREKYLGDMRHIAQLVFGKKQGNRIMQMAFLEADLKIVQDKGELARKIVDGLNNPDDKEKGEIEDIRKLLRGEVSQPQKQAAVKDEKPYLQVDRSLQVLEKEQLFIDREVEGHLRGARSIQLEGVKEPVDFEIYEQIVEGKPQLTIRATKLKPQEPLKMIWRSNSSSYDVFTIKADEGMVVWNGDLVFYKDSYFVVDGNKFRKPRKDELNLVPSQDKPQLITERK